MKLQRLRLDCVCLQSFKLPARSTTWESHVDDLRDKRRHFCLPLFFSVLCRSYIKLINMVSGSSGQMQVNNISGYLPGRIVFFLLNTHITPRPVLLTRHGESQYNVSGRIGGDPPLSPRGEEYSVKLAEFLQKRLKHERMASVGLPSSSLVPFSLFFSCAPPS